MSKRNLITHGKTYWLNPPSMNAMHLSVWVVAIENQAGDVITRRRVAGESQADAEEAAEQWLMSLLRANPGALLGWTITQHIEK